LLVIFRTRATNYRALLRKVTYKDKASCDSAPPCTHFTIHSDSHIYESQLATQFSKHNVFHSTTPVELTFKKIYASGRASRNDAPNHPQTHTKAQKTDVPQNICRKNDSSRALVSHKRGLLTKEAYNSIKERDVSAKVCYRVAKTHRIPYLYRSFSAKVTYIERLFCGK